MMRRRFRYDLWTFVLIAAWVILLILLIWPLSSILRASLLDNETGAFSFVHYFQIFTTRVYQRAIGNTLIAGFGGMAGALVLGVTLAFVTTRFHIYGRALIQTLAVVALVSPPFIGAYAWIVLFGASGVVRKGLASIGISIPPLYGMLGVILVFAFKFFPHVFLITSGALSAINRSVEEAAESLGVSPARRLFTVTFPLILPAISASALLTFVLSIADFGTPRIIGRDFNVLATEAFNLYGGEVGGNPGMASALSIVLIILSMIIVFGQRWVLRKNVYHSNLIKKPERQHVGGVKSVGLHVLAYAIVLIGALPAIIVVLFSFRRTSGPVFQPGLSLQSYEKVISTVSDPIWNTLLFSTVAVVAIVITGTLIGYLISRRPNIATGALDATLMIPYVVPGIVMGIAFITRFNDPPLALTGTGLIIIMAVFIRRLPYSARSVAAALKQVGPNLEDAAVSLGYSPGKAFMKVTVPLIVPGILAGALMSFVTAMNELSSSLVLYVGSTITMPVRIYLSVMDGEYGTASALSTILLVMTVVAVYAAFHLSGRKESALL
ncbi:ABC transporter permease [Microvirga subterranea]|uniref:Iron(III) transport system permease protein n=1 Tax=Microvirga subterranea TaxID=186651 RepID=A0A370HVU9_9HYPH|nr:iron ABC transporter permease [Microvirga subterranea]RDI62627.1 iron(III) transport system permease protein [Microvirga subterranea]